MNRFVITGCTLFTLCDLLAAATLRRGPYLQNGTPTSVVVRWRTDTATDTVVRFGSAPGSLGQWRSNPSTTTEHEMTISGLTRDSLYYYAIGSSTETLAGNDAEHYFMTFPAIGTPTKARVWVLGDAGTQNANQAAVRDAYYGFTRTPAKHTDLWLMLGDNAYQSGTDDEYQAAVFDMYPAMLRKSVLFSTLGNHDTGQSVAYDDPYPYFSNFTLPTEGEGGGVPSGTEHFYSFDFGNIHFICLDSMTASRAPTGPMANWLRSDLENTLSTWIVAFWHHPPYSRGSHNSDFETELIEMRQNINPILEAGGVDLVLSGHSHSYERSFLIDEHYESSGTFSAGHVIDGGSGRGAGAYRKPAGPAAHRGAIYSVAGSSGQVSGGSHDHPAMFVSLNLLGSVVLDFATNRLDFRFVDSSGAVQDNFTIIKGGVTNPPPLPPNPPTSITAVAGNAQVALQWSASASATSYKVKRSTSAGGGYVTLAENVTATSYVDATAANGTTYFYVVSAVNANGESANSIKVSATPAANPAPAVPASLTAVAGNAQVALQWNASANATRYKVKRSTSTGGPYVTLAENVTAMSYVDATAANGTTYFYVVSAVNANGESPNSSEVSATPVSDSAPAAPTELAGSSTQKRKITLTWTQSAGSDVAENKIYRARRAGRSFKLIATVPATNSFLNKQLLSGARFRYYVTAVNDEGQESAPSNEIEVRAR